ncbi:MAG: hypothetical protein FWB93_06630 [Oscillospiraceae bacterium]|nr:hypothetical protein [Oscillospiraceae bacterium]
MIETQQLQETTTTQPTECDRIRELEEENNRLTTELAQQAYRKDEDAKFASLFPDVTRDTIPTQVFDHAKEEGLPLYAAYAVYAWEVEAKRAIAALAEEENRRKATGGVAGTGSERSFSREDLLAMSPKEVKQNFAEIISYLAG